MSRPIEELKGFERTHLHDGESKNVTLHLAAQSLGYWNKTQHAFVVEPGPIELRIGASSDEIKLSKTLNIAR